MQLDDRVFFKLEGMPDLLKIKTLVFEKLPIENFKGLKFPKKLPNLKSIQIRNCPLTSLEGLPSEMPNLKSISIGNIPNLQNANEFPKEIPEFNITVYNLQELRSLGILMPQTPKKIKIQTLNGFPKIIPEIDSLFLTNLPELRSLEGLPPQTPKLNSIRLQDLPNLHSFKGLPSKLPRLYKLEIHDVDLLTLRDLPENLHPKFHLKIWNYKPKDSVLFDFAPNTPFEGLHIIDYIIKDFSFMNNFTTEDFKKLRIYLYFERCLIRSFEGFPEFPENTNFKEIFDEFDDNFNITEPSITFAIGTKIRSLSGLSLHFLKYILPHYSINDKLFDFAPHGRELFENCIDREYIKRTISEQNQTIQMQTEIEQVQILNKRSQKAFIVEKLPELYEYFKTPILKLAYQYISDPVNMPPDQIERLVHEADYNIRKILENALPPKNPLLLQISQKLSFETANGLKILK